jgi:sulfide dehydrogenase [flavocytochrome c] flavoprotein chain
VTGWRLPRRQVLAGLGSAAMVAPLAHARRAGRVVIIGGGYGGASAARTLKAIAPSASVTLVEPRAQYFSCPFSNLVLAGLRPARQQVFPIHAIEQTGVTHLKDYAEDIDPGSRTVRLRSNARIGYDKLILSPGVEMRWDALEGYGPDAAQKMPHAWHGASQANLLRRRLEAMEDGATVVMSVPPAPYRCPPGPYERASLIAHYLKTRKPRSRLLVLDAKDSFSKMPLFQEAWAEHYPDHLEWRSAFNDGRVSRVDAGAMTVHTDFETHKADVANIIPPQKAASIAERAGVADATGWCPIDAVSFESTLQPDIHVIGDAAIASPMPKSAFAANLQGKICAIQITRALAGLKAEPTRLVNTCYSYVAPGEAVSIAGAYTNEGGTFRQIEGAGGTTPVGAERLVREVEASQAQDWFAAITQETFG